MRLATAVVVTVCLAVGSGAAFGRSKKSRRHHHHHKRSADPVAEGRSHLKKANALAGEGDCVGAIIEYTAAYEKLDDPVVLFNRAECYRRTHNAESAVADYRAFLDKVPQARNRADVEAKIATLAPPPPEPEEPEPTTPPSPAPVVAAPPAPEPEAPPVVVRRPAPPPDSAADSGGSSSHWWAWTLLGVLAVGGAVAGIVMFRPQESQPPDSTWGNYRF